MKLLEGVRVVELAQMVAGPACAKHLADLGADVVKVEPPFVGDAARHIGPFAGGWPDPERSLLFLAVNTSKRGVTLDVRQPLGARILEQLLGWADIFIEDNPPQVARELGLDYAALADEFPRLVVVSVTPFGQDGPYSDYKAYPLNTFHGGGEGYLTPPGAQWLDRPPLKQGRYVGEYEVALAAATPALAALFHSRATGQGQQIDLSKQEALIGFNLRELQPYLASGLTPSRTTRSYLVGGTMACKDGYVALALHEESQWQGVVKMMGNPGWAEQDWFKDPKARLARGAELNELIGAWLREHTKEEIFHWGQECGCTVAPYYTPQEVVESELLQARQFFQEVAHPSAGSFAYAGAPYHLNGEPVRLGPAPLLGQHNEDVYCGLLGYSRDQLVQLRAMGVV